MKIEFIQKPCEDAARWLESQPDAKTAWNNCQRGDWMWWALRSLEGAAPEKEISVKFARWCARRAKKFAPFNVIASAAAADATRFSKDAVYYTGDAYAVSRAAHCAFGAAYSTARAAYVARATCDQDAAAAEAIELAAQADWIRKHVQCPFKGVIS